MIAGVSLWIQVALPFFALAIKLIVMNYSIYHFKKTNKASNENIPMIREFYSEEDTME